MSKAKQAISKSMPETKRLELEVERLHKQLDDMRKSRFRLPTGKPKGRKKGSFCRVIIPDSHGCYIDPLAAKAFLSDLEQIAPAEIVMLGDHLDASGFLAEHHTLSFIPETTYTFADDEAATNQFLDAIQERAPGARIHYLEGNHERRIEKWIVDKTIKNPADATFLKNLFSVETVLGLSKRGIEHYEQGKFYHDLPLPSTIKLGHCYFTHGEYTSKHAAAAHLSKYGGNVVFGHTHRRDSFFQRTVKEGQMGAWNPGCLCLIQRLWNYTNLTNWAHGYGLQAVQKDGSFLHINVPIIDGVSYLQPLASGIGG